MIPVYLRLTNFMSHVNSEIRFDELDPVTLIIGMKNGDPKKANGAGKSVIFDSVSWVFYEKSRASGSDATNIDSVVRSKAEKCEVEFHFLIGEDLYRVIRSRDRKKKKSDLIFEVQSGGKWHSVAADKKGETNAIIVKIIGMNHEVFESSVLLRQHEAAAFAEMTPGERKEVVTEILQLKHYDEYMSQAKKRLEKLNEQAVEDDIFLQNNSSVAKEKVEAELEIQFTKEKIEVYQKKIEAIKGVIEKLRSEQGEEGRKLKLVQDLLEQRDQIRVRIQKNTAGLRDLSESIKRYEVGIEKIKLSLKQKQDRVMQIKQERGDPSVLKREIDQWSAKAKELTDQKTALYIEVESVGNQIKQLRGESDRITNLNEGVCPGCYQPVTSNSKHAALEVFEAKLQMLNEKYVKGKELLKESKTFLEVAQEHHVEAQAKREIFNKLQQEGRTLMEIMGVERTNLETQTRTLEDNQALKKSSVDGLAATQEELARCLEKIETLGEVDQTKFQQLSRQIVDKNTEFETSQKTMNEVQRKIGGLQERVEHQQQILKKMEVLKEQRVKLDQERRIEKELMNAFGKTGIQALILENSAIEIEKIANDLLTKLTNGSINIKIQTQRANQDGSLKEVFDIIVTDEYHSSPFNMYSGGEKFRIAFVVRVALSILLSRRAGVRVGAIFYDEAFQDLDDDGIDKMVEVFKLLSADFRYQLVISHTSELKNQFRDVLVVNKTSAGSFVSKR